MGTQITLATHRFPKSHAHRAPQWPRHLATGPSLALATALASSPSSTCRQHRALCQLKQPSKHQKTRFFYTPTLPPRRGFVTHRRAHMRACSLHRCARMRTCSLHKCASVRTYLFHRRAPMCVCSPYKRAEVRACSTHKRAQVCACSTHECAPVQLTGAPFERALNPLYRVPMRVYPVGRRALMRAYHRIARACGAHTP
jgi:hypothetical protein